MNRLQSTIERGLEAQEALERPRPKVQATVFSVYAPKDLIVAFKSVCASQRKSHATIMRRLMAQYISDARQKENDFNGRERRTKNSEGNERHVDAAQ